MKTVIKFVKSVKSLVKLLNQLNVISFNVTLLSVLGKLPPRKIALSPNSNDNPKPNSDPDRGNFPRGQFSGHLII